MHIFTGIICIKYVNMHNFSPASVDNVWKLCYSLSIQTIYDLSTRKGDAGDGDPGKRILYVDVHAFDAALDLPDHAFVCVIKRLA